MITTKLITTKSKGNCGIKRSTGARYRLVHDGKNVLAIVDVDEKAKTESIYTIVEADTEKECFSEIAKLKLKYDDAESIEDIKTYKELLA